MLEKTVEKKCMALAKKRGFLFLKWQNTAQKGVPDRILIGPGIIEFVELKRPGGKPTKLQLAMHRKIDSAYGEKVCWIIDSVEAFEELIIATQRAAAYNASFIKGTESWIEG